MQDKGELLFCKIACSALFVRREQVDMCLKLQEAERSQGRSRSIGQILRDMGFLTETQVKQVLDAQRRTEIHETAKVFGKLVIANGFATEEQIRECLQLQKDELNKPSVKARPLGQIMVERGILTAQEVGALLTAQGRLRQAPAAPVPGRGPELSPAGVHAQALAAAGERYEDVSRRKKSVLAVVLGVAGVLVGIVILALIFRDGDAAPDKSPELKTTTVDPRAERLAADREEEARKKKEAETVRAAKVKTYQEAIDFADRNPEKYDFTMEVLSQAVTALEGTEWHADLVRRRAALQTKLDEAGEKKYLAIEAGYQVLVAGGDLGAACALLNEFPPALAGSQAAKKIKTQKEQIRVRIKESLEECRRSAEAAAQAQCYGRALALYRQQKACASPEMAGEIERKISDMSQKIRAQGPAALVRVEKYLPILRDEIAKLIQKGQVDEALKKHEDYAASSNYDIARAALPQERIFVEYDRLAQDLQRAVAVRDKVIAHFAAQIGGKVTVRLRIESLTGTVERAEGNEVALKVGDAVKTFGIHSLAPETLTSLIEEGNKESYDAIAGYYMAGGRVDDTKRFCAKAEKDGIDMAYWTTRIALGDGAGPDDPTPGPGASTGKNAVEVLAQALEAFGQGSHEKTLGLLVEFSRASKDAPINDFSAFNEQCRGTTGFSLAGLVETCRTQCAFCGCCGRFPCSNTRCGKGRVRTGAAGKNCQHCRLDFYNLCGGSVCTTCGVEIVRDQKLGWLPCPICDGLPRKCVSCGKSDDEGWDTCNVCKGKDCVPCDKCKKRRERTDYVTAEKAFKAKEKQVEGR
ncbi:MAG: hypothetical protein RDV41_02635 [Planctomycetota bacterium]|nr:hypothetical protein [Planctomycetota bacterium]